MVWNAIIDPQIRGVVLHKPRIGIVPDVFLVKSVWLREISSRAAHGKQASHFAIRCVVAQCCHYQRSVAAVLENVVFCSKRLL